MLTNQRGDTYFFQWDTGQKVVLSEDLALCDYIHFKNPNSDVAYRVKVVNKEALVPDELLQGTDAITAWAYTDAEHRTMFSQTFYVSPRQKPADYEFTPTDAEVYKTLNERVEAVEAKAANNAMAVNTMDARVTGMEKVIDTVTTTPIPAGDAERQNYKVLAVKTGGAEPTGCNFDLGELLNAEATQEELDALQKQITDNKTAQDTKNVAMEGEIAKKVDATAQGVKDGEQDGKINENKTNLDDLKMNHQLYVMGLKPKNLATYLGATGSTPEAVCKDAFAKLRAKVSKGNFDGLNLGDYINIPKLNLPEVLEQQEVLDEKGNIVTPYMEHEDARTLTGNPNYTNLRVQIVGFNHYWSIGSATNIRKPHLVMEFAGVPCTHWFNRKVKDPLPPNSDGTIPSKPDPWNYKHWDYWTKGDYNKSQLRAWLEKCFCPALVEAVGYDPIPIDRIIGTVGSWSWCGAEKVFLPTNLEVLGNTGWATRSNGYSTGTSRQYALHAINPATIMHDSNGSRYYYWLAEPQSGSSADFCYVDYSGDADYSYAYSPLGVVPAFLIG